MAAAVPAFGLDEHYRLLRMRLDQLEYRDAFSIDSMSLIQRLLSDLIQTTETSKKLKGKIEELTREKKTAVDQLDPLRYEIARVSSENNQLHLDLIKSQEINDEKEKKFAIIVRKYENQIADLKFMNSQYFSKIQAEQKKTDMEKRRIQEMFAKQGLIEKEPKTGPKPSTQKTDVLFQKLQKIDLETGLEPLAPPFPKFVPPDPVVCDMVKLSEARIELMDKTIDDLSSKNKDLENEIQLIRDQLGKREQEIARLGAQLEISRSQQYLSRNTVTNISKLGSSLPTFEEVESRLPTGGETMSNQRVAQLEMHVEYLQEHISELEKEMSVYDRERSRLREEVDKEKQLLSLELEKERDRNAGLLRNLHKLEGMLEELSKLRPTSPARSVGKSGDEKKSSKEIYELKERLRKQDEILRKTKTQLMKVQEEVQKEVTERPSESVAQLQTKIKEQHAYITQMKSELDALQAQYGKISDENYELKNLVGQSKAELHELTSQLDTAMQHYAELRATSPAKSTKHGSTSTSTSPTPGATHAAHHLTDATNSNIIRTLQKKLNDMETAKWVMDKDVEGLQAKIKTLTEANKEFETYKSRVQVLQRELTTRSDECVSLKRRIEMLEKSVTSEKNGKEVVERQKREVEKERTDLLHALQMFDGQLSDVQSQITNITAERDNIANLYEQVTTELEQLRRDRRGKSTSPSPKRTRASTQQTDSESVAKESQTELESLQLREEELSSELVSAKKRIQLLESELSNKQSYRQVAASPTPDSEKVKLKTMLSEKERVVLDLKHKVEGLEKERKSLKEELERKSKEVSELHKDKDRKVTTIAIQEITDPDDLRLRLEDTVSRLKRTRGDLERLQREYETKCTAFNDQTRLLAKLDREKDVYQSELDQKAEKVVEYQGIISNLRKESSQMENELIVLREGSDMLNLHLKDFEREASSLQRQVETLTRERDHLFAESQRHAQEARNLSTDLTAITRENQVLNGELSEIVGERERLKADLVECDNRIRYLEEVIKAKDQERDHLMTNYKRLIAEHEKLDMTLRMSTDEGHHMKMEVVMRDKKVVDLAGALDESQNELRQAKGDLQALEKQCSALTRNLSSAERTIKQLQDDKSRYIRDINAARDLSLTIDRSKEELHKQLTTLSVEIEHANKNIQKLELDKEGLTEQLRAERLKIERLEHLIAVERTKKIQTERNALDLQVTKGDLEERLESVSHEQKVTLTSLSKELGILQEENQLLRAKVESLEQSSRKRLHDLEKTQEESRRLRAKLEESELKIKNKEAIIDDIMHSRAEGNNSNSVFDSRIHEELEHTRKELREHEALLARKSLQRTDSAEEYVVASMESPVSASDALQRGNVSAPRSRTGSSQSPQQQDFEALHRKNQQLSQQLGALQELVGDLKSDFQNDMTMDE